jgi:F-type H+-transporting ATPase subunit delta
VSSNADNRVARRYAGALFGAARRAARLDAVQRDLDTLAALWQQTPALRQMMESPLIPGERKFALVEQIFGTEIDSLTRSFLRLLIEKRREEILEEAQVEFRRRADAERGLLRAQATVAAPLDEGQRAALIAGLQQRTGKQVELDVGLDPGILGGVVVRMQDTVIDGSVRGALERLRERMLLER